MLQPCPAPTVPCPSWMSAWWPEISELLVQQRNKSSFFVVCCYHSFPRPWQTVFGFTLATCIWNWYALDKTSCNSAWWPEEAEHGQLAHRLSLDGHAVPWPWEKWHCRGWHGHGMASVNQTRPHCVNQMGKTHSKPLAARHGRGTTWARHGNGMLCVNRPLFQNIESGIGCNLNVASLALNALIIWVHYSITQYKGRYCAS